MRIRAKVAILVISLWCVSGIVSGASRSATQTLLVQIRPEAALSYLDNEALLLRIRLAPGARASIWKAQNCEKPAAGAPVVDQSGTQVVALSVIPGPPDALICLTTSDGSIAVTLRARRTNRPPPASNLPPF